MSCLSLFQKTNWVWTEGVFLSRICFGVLMGLVLVLVLVFGVQLSFVLFFCYCFCFSMSSLSHKEMIPCWMSTRMYSRRAFTLLLVSLVLFGCFGYVFLDSDRTQCDRNNAIVFLLKYYFYSEARMYIASVKSGRFGFGGFLCFSSLRRWGVGAKIENLLSPFLGTCVHSYCQQGPSRLAEYGNSSIR